MMSIGELARSTRESVRTLRYWSDRGLLETGRSESGYRHFPPATVDRVAFIRRAQALGFALEEIRDIIALRSQGVAPCHDVRDRLVRHLADIHERIVALHTLADDVEQRLQWATVDIEPECPQDCVYLTSDPPMPGGARETPASRV